MLEIVISFVILLVAVGAIVFMTRKSYFSSSTPPKNIIVIRHAEKHPPQNYLDPQGKMRALRLIDWVKHTVPTQFLNGEKIDVIVTPMTQLSGKDFRPIQTISLVSFHEDIPIYAPLHCFDTKKVYDFISSSFPGKNVLVCWEHTCLQQLMSEFGISAPHWSGDDFSSVYHVVPTSSGGYTLKSITCEDIMPNDVTICNKTRSYKKQECKH